MKSSVDVDCECMTIFEQRLFESSIKAGRAGSGIWGLDVGPLQDEWYPYNKVPTYWRDPNFQDLADDLEVSCILLY
ncbi:hypothetical protein BDQ17DRAFT_1267377 [Cyathus striatus]|nr:hypothetical protein BDQ17DRAFT_1267377 [Cyathus striatus]